MPKWLILFLLCSVLISCILSQVIHVPNFQFNLLERFKARLVVIGNTQWEGEDYHDTFSPVVQMATIRTMTAQKHWPLLQLDVNNTFLHGDLFEKVYMKVPSGFHNPSHKVCKLHKFLYGWKQASHQWFAKLSDALKTQGFKPSKSDSSLFIHTFGKGISLMAIYVDNILLTGSNPAVLQRFKGFLDRVSSIKDLGALHFFHGIEVSHAAEVQSLSQFIQHPTQDHMQAAMHLLKYTSNTAT